MNSRAQVICLAGVVGLATVVLPARQQDDVRLSMIAVGAPPANAIWLDSLDLSKMVQRRQTPRAGQTLARARGRGAGAAAAQPQGRGAAPARRRSRSAA